MAPATHDEIAAVFREAHGRAIATLIRAFGDVDVAEEAVADAFVVALARWPVTGLPPSPAGFIVTTAKNRAIDILRREGSRADRHAAAQALVTPHDAGSALLLGDPDIDVRDGRVRPSARCGVHRL